MIQTIALLLLLSALQHSSVVRIVGGSRTVSVPYHITEDHYVNIPLEADVDWHDPTTPFVQWAVSGKKSTITPPSGERVTLRVFEIGEYVIQVIASNGAIIKSDAITITVTEKEP